MNNDWSDKEVELIINDYFSMLISELRGENINKTYHRNLLLPRLDNRTNGSIEFKHQNISAVLIDMGMPYIRGYKPRYNSQKSKLISKIQSFLKATPQTGTIFNDFTERIDQIEIPLNYDNWIVSAPHIKEHVEKKKSTRYPRNINYLEKEQNNIKLGSSGEELALKFERYNLIKVGKESLADKIEWVSRELGDGLGYDILSKNLNGSDKYIEVKTTKLTIESPFFFTSNEYKFSVENRKNFHLYRIFNFGKNTKMFCLNGSYDDFCKIDAIQYKGSF